MIGSCPFTGEGLREGPVVATGALTKEAYEGSLARMPSIRQRLTVEGELDWTITISIGSMAVGRECGSDETSWITDHGSLINNITNSNRIC